MPNILEALERDPDPVQSELRRVRDRSQRALGDLRKLRAQRVELADELKAQGRDPLSVIADPRDDLDRRYVDLLERERELSARVEQLADRQSKLIVALAEDRDEHAWSKALAPYVDAKALTDASYSVPPPVPTGIVEEPRRARFVRELLSSETLEVGDRFTYLRQTVRDVQARPVAAGEVKPTSVLTVTRIEDTVRTIAHISEPLSRSDLADFTLLQDFVDGELRYGLLLAEDQQIINGDGTGENMTGLLNTAGILSVARGTDSRSDALRKAITALQKENFEPQVVLMHPDDAEKMFLEKTADGAYMFAAERSPIDPTTETVWGVPSFVSVAVPVGTAIVADLSSAARLFVREDAAIEFNASHADLFVRNMVVGRAEERLGLAVLRPRAICAVSGL